MFWKDFSATLVAFVLLIAVGELSLHAMQTGDGQAGPSDDPSQIFLTNAEEISIPELDKELVVNLRVPQVRGDLPDHEQRCQGAMAQLTDSDDGHLFTAIVTRRECWEQMQRVPNRVDKAITNGGTEVSFDTPPLPSSDPLIAVFKVTNPEHLPAVPVAKPMMPRDNSVKGITVTTSGAKIFRVASRKNCNIRLDWFCVSARNGVPVDEGIALGAPFFVKSSGKIYLAGLHQMFHRPVPKFRGGHIYSAVY